MIYSKNITKMKGLLIIIHLNFNYVQKEPICHRGGKRIAKFANLRVYAKEDTISFILNKMYKYI